MKTILITGTSSGIGQELVRFLSDKQYRIIATVRKIEDAEKIKKTFLNHVIPIVIDLSNLSQIEKIPDLLKKEFNIVKLDGLINNAGIALAAPFLDQSFSEVESIISLNVLSVMKLTQVMLPLLGAKNPAVDPNKEPGVIINISSISGTGGAPFLAAYAASKHAIEGFSDALRKELMIFGIKVVVVGPGSIKTPIWSKGFGQGADCYAKSIYAESFKKFISFALNEEKNALEVSDISKLIFKILNQKNPAFRYAPIPRKIMNWYIPKLMPKRIYNLLTAKALGLIRQR
ncbi:MAG: SDR family NAD(P)-dependent oxidoreductase [Pseudobdellovibrio sp.]